MSPYREPPPRPRFSVPIDSKVFFGPLLSLVVAGIALWQSLPTSFAVLLGLVLGAATSIPALCEMRWAKRWRR